MATISSHRSGLPAATVTAHYLHLPVWTYRERMGFHLDVNDPSRGLPPGKEIRFAVGNKDDTTAPRSKSWRLWSAKNSSDVYLADRVMAGQMKLSFHESGSWSYSYLNDEIAKGKVTPGASRHVHLWQQPDEIYPNWRVAYSIFVPRSDLAPKQAPERKAIHWVPPPLYDEWVSLDVLIGDGDIALFTKKGYVVDSLRLVDGRLVGLMARRLRPDAFQAQTLASLREMIIGEMATNCPERLHEQLAGEFPRVQVTGENSDGVHFEFDLALKIAPPGWATPCTGPFRVHPVFRDDDNGATEVVPGSYALPDHDHE